MASLHSTDQILPMCLSSHFQAAASGPVMEGHSAAQGSYSSRCGWRSILTFQDHTFSDLTCAFVTSPQSECKSGRTVSLHDLLVESVPRTVLTQVLVPLHGGGLIVGRGWESRPPSCSDKVLLSVQFMSWTATGPVTRMLSLKVKVKRD